MGDTSGRARAWGWVSHLRHGGTTAWSQWHDEAEPSGRVVPGAQQLETLRRLNETAAAAEAEVPSGLAQRVLEASAPGRGRPDLELVGAAHDSRFGAQPVDPSELPDEELLRVATLLLAEDLVALGPVAGPADRLPRPWRSRYRLVGDPLLADPVRRSLIARGRGPRPGGEIVVVGAGVERMLADVWTASCFESGVPSWQNWLETWRQRKDLPPRVNLPRIVGTWSQRRGADHVHVLVEGTPAWDRLPSLVGVRRLEVSWRPSVQAAELARGVASVLGMMVNPPRRAELLHDGLLPRLPADALVAVGDSEVRLPAVPSDHEEWVRRAARRMERRLAAAGHQVDLRTDLRAESRRPDARRPATGDDQGVLSLAVRMLLGSWKERG